MDFIDRLLTCGDCGGEFIFTAGEQLFFFDKQFKNDPKRCKPCKSKRATASGRAAAGPAGAVLSRTETRTECSACGIETTVPFKPTQGRPVLCRQCFQNRQSNPAVSLELAQATSHLNSATAELMASGSGGQHVSGSSNDRAGDRSPASSQA
jgi:CxxC-x17-CxxC domain-containing protein